MKKNIVVVVALIVFVGIVVFLAFNNKAENTQEKHDLIRVHTPEAGASIKSPMLIRGEARGPWFFEADFPIVLVDSDRTMIGETIATAQGEWMTEEFVPFEARLYFELPPGVKNTKGALIFHKHNASGLPEHDDSFEINVLLYGGGESGPTIEQELSLSYEDEENGMRFEYKVSPKGYILEEPPISELKIPDLLKAVILTRIADYEELQLSDGGREGPPTINVYVFNANNLSLLGWLKNERSFTNFTDNSEQSYVIGGLEGVRYNWDGLYQGETIVVKHDGKIYMIVGTYLTGMEDGRRDDFRNLINSFTLLE